MKKLFLRVLLFIILAVFSLGSGILIAEIHLRNDDAGKQKIPVSSPFGALALSDTKKLNDQPAENGSMKEAAPEAAASENLSDNSQNSFSFAVLGDTQRFNPDTAGNFQKATASIRKLNPDLVFAVGDLVGSCDGGSSCEKKYEDWKNIMSPILSKTYEVIGNHDRTGEEKADAVWQKEFNLPTNGPPGFSELTYSFDSGNSHFVALNSEKPKEHIINSEQRDWLEKDLSNSKKENIFVFFHEPAFPVSSKIEESLDVQSRDRDALWQILDKHNVTAVFNGHEHIVSRRKIDSSVMPGAKNTIYQFVFGNTDSFNHDLPAAGIAEYSNQGQGRFGIVKVNGKEMTVEVHAPDGSMLNSFTF